MPTKTEIRSANISAITIDPTQIDWGKLQRHFQIMYYQMPWKNKKDKNYYERMHNWYKETSDYPCYLHTYGPRLFVAYPSADEVQELKYEGKSLSYKSLSYPLEMTDSDFWPNLIKVLVSDYFHKHEEFVSNAHFLLQIEQIQNFTTALKIEIKHDWQNNPNRFLFIDKATNLRRLTPSEMNNRNWYKENHYGLFYQHKSAILKQLKPREARSIEQQKEGIYVTYSTRKNPAHVTHHSIKSLEKLRTSRSASLNRFFKGLLNYFNTIGLPFELQTLSMQRVNKPRVKKILSPHLEQNDSTIYVVDDRLRPIHIGPDDYAEQICQQCNTLFQNKGVNFSLAQPDKLKLGDYVLRLQDYEKQDFVVPDDENKEKQLGLLAAHGIEVDPYLIFKQKYPHLANQSLNINTTVKDKHDSLTVKQYLNYILPKRKDLKMRLEVCVNQILLKAAAQGQKQVTDILPQATEMADKLYLYKNVILYYEDNRLQFVPIQEQEISESVTQKYCGYSLFDDVIFPVANHHAFNPDNIDIDKAIKDLKKHRLILHRNYILEIEDVQSRVLYDDETIQQRLQAGKIERPLQFYRPKFPVAADTLFDEEQLRKFDEFLTEQVRESFISYDDLKYYYGKHIRNKQGEKINEDGGFYRILGIKNDIKLKNYLNIQHGKTLFASPKSKDVVPFFQDIWYHPKERYYLVGFYDSYKWEQERGHVLRHVICHSPDLNDQQLQALLMETVFPMLTVQFIRHNNYTVYPFPFKLIEMWQKWQDDQTVDE